MEATFPKLHGNSINAVHSDVVAKDLNRQTANMQARPNLAL
jgi:hypothetical protein